MPSTKFTLVKGMHMNKRKSKIKWMLLFFGIALLAVLADQYTKHLAIEHLQDREAFPLIKGVLEFQFFSNTGMAWSLLEGQSFFILFIGLIFLAVMLFCILKLPDSKKFHILYVFGGILTGGAIGNMADRLRLGYVVDFIYFSLINFPIFNVADMCIVISIVVLGYLFLFVYKEEDMSFLNFKQKKFREVK